VEAAAKALADSKAAAEAAAKELEAAQQRIPALEAELKAARTKVAEVDGPASKAREALLTAWSDTFASIALSPLMPEQLCWSTMQATGFFEAAISSGYSRMGSEESPERGGQGEPAKQVERSAAIQKAFREKLRAHEDQYVRVFGGAAGQPQTEFFATPEQALYFENGGVLRSWTVDAGCPPGVVERATGDRGRTLSNYPDAAPGRERDSRCERHHLCPATGKAQWNAERHGVGSHHIERIPILSLANPSFSTLPFPPD
jgi:hypothetical protein